jgi:hypothetical protein
MACPRPVYFLTVIPRPVFQVHYLLHVLALGQGRLCLSEYPDDLLNTKMVPANPDPLSVRRFDHRFSQNPEYFVAPG